MKGFRLALQQASFLGANFLVYDNELARQQTRENTF
jgi:hypothetical protein